MASTQGEIRVGPSHQARLPDFRSGVSSTEVSDLSPCTDLERGREDLRWVPAMTLDTDLLMYLRAARSMAAFAGMCDGGSPDDGCIAASRDDTTINALDVLHDAGYDPGKALQALVKCPVPKGIDKKWSEEETKRFVKGLRQFGKNFFRIRKDLLPHKDTSELVEFYYLWKKTPGANNNRPHRRNRRQGSLRRIRNTRNTRGGNNQPKEVDATSPVTTSAGSASSSSPSSSSRPSPNCKDPGEVSSGSEEENSEDENSDSRDNSSLRCQHCFSANAREWQPPGKERSQFCTCNKKYSELPLTSGTVVVNSSLSQGRGEAPYLFRPVQNVETAEDSSGRMRTRTRAKEQSKSETPTKGRKRVQMELDNEDDKDITLYKRRRNDTADSPAESLTTDSGSVADDVDGGETNEQEAESLENSSVSVVCSTSECSGINVFQPEYSSGEKMHTLGSSMTLPSITNTALSLVASTLPQQFTLPPPPPIQNLPSSVSISLPSPLLPSQGLTRLPSSLPLLPVIVVSAASHGTISNATGTCTTAAVSNTTASSSVTGDIRSRNINYGGNKAAGNDVSVTTVAGATNSAIVNSSSSSAMSNANIPLAISSSSTDSDSVNIAANASKSIIILTTSASNVSSCGEATTVSSTSVSSGGTAIIGSTLAMLSAVPPNSVEVSDGSDTNAISISNSCISPTLLSAYPSTTANSITCSVTTNSTTTTFTTVADTSSDANSASSSITSVAGGPSTSIPNTILSSIIASDCTGTDGTYSCSATASAMSIVNATTTVSGNINVIMPFTTSVITTSNSPCAISIVSHSNATAGTASASSHTSIAAGSSTSTTLSTTTTAAGLAVAPACSTSAHISAACISSTCPSACAAITPFAPISFPPTTAAMAASVSTCSALIASSVPCASTSATNSATTVNAPGDGFVGVKTVSPAISAPVTTISSGIPTTASIFSTTVATTTTTTLTTSLACPSTPTSSCISSGTITPTLSCTSTFSTTTVTTAPTNANSTTTTTAATMMTSAITSGSVMANSDYISNNCSTLENNDPAGAECITTVIVTPTVGNILSSITSMDTNVQLPFLQEDLRVSGDIALRSSKSRKLSESEMHIRCGQVTGNVSNNTFEKVQNLDRTGHDNPNGNPLTDELLRTGDLKQEYDRDFGNHSSEVDSLSMIPPEDVKLERDDDFYCNKDILCRRKKDGAVLVKDHEVSSFSDVTGGTGMNNNLKINKEDTEPCNDSILNRMSVNLPLNDANSAVGSGSSTMNVSLSNSSSLSKNGINILPNHPHVTSIKVEPGLTSEEQLQLCNERDEKVEMNRNELLLSQRSSVSNISSVLGVSQNSSSIPGSSERSSPLPVTNRSLPRNNATAAEIQPNSSGDLPSGLPLGKGTFLPTKYEDNEKISQLQNPVNGSQTLPDHTAVHSNNGQTNVLSQGFNFMHSSSYHVHQRFGNSSGENGKNEINANSSVANCDMNQNEPQNLKIKQEVLPQSERQTSDPLQSLKEVKIPGYSTSNLPVSQPLTGSCSSTSQSSSSFSGDIRRSPANNESTNFLGPLVENIKKEPENFIACSDGTLGTSGTISTPSKASSKIQPSISDSSFPSLHVSPLSRVSSNTPPMISSISTHISVSHSAVSLISPTRLTPTSLAPGLSNSIAHPSQQNSPISRSSPGHPHPTPHPHPHPHPTPHPHSSPFIGPPSSHPVLHHHPHTLIHHSLFAAAAQAAAVHHNPYHPPHPYAPYSYPFPYHYGPLPQPHPLPHHSPPASVISSVTAPTSSLQQRHEQAKAERQSLDCSLSLNASPAGPSRREITNDEIVSTVNQTSERHHSQEVGSPLVHHQSQHSSQHQNQGEKQVHSSSQTSSLQLQTSVSAATSTSHKINSSLKCSSAGNRVSPTCHSTPIMSTAQPASTSIPLSLSNMHHSHGHHHQHIHHSPSIPGGTSTSCVDTSSSAILSSSNTIVSTNSRVHYSNASHISSHSYHTKHSSHPVLMVQPPSLSQQGIGLNLPSSVPTSSLEALRAHAQAAANVQQQQQLQVQQQQIQCTQPLQNSGLQLAIMHSSPNSPVSVPGTHQLTSRHGQGYNDDVKVEPQLDIAETQQEEEIPSPSHIPRGPSPEPKIEDTECHRSQSAIFLRHWNRGDFNSCTRTDLTFKPVPDSKLARKREERLRKQAEKEREEREKVAAQAHSHKLSTPEKEGTKPPSRGPIETITSPYDRFTPRQGYDTPALRQLSEYARPHAGFSPGTLPRPSTLGLTPQCIDPLLHYQLNSMYAPGARERLELEHIEREKREREIRELRERELNDRLKDELIKSAGTGPRMANSLDPHWLDLQRRYAGLGTGGPAHQFGLYASPTAPGQTSLNQLERERLERLGIPTGPSGPHGPAAVGASGPHSAHSHPHAAHASSVAAAQAAQAQLEAAERLALATDPMVRLQMAGISPEYHAHTHAHTHAHSHTHLHLHPGQQAAQAQQAQQEAAAVAAGSAAFPLPASAGTGYPRPSLLPARDPAIGLHHPPELLGRGPGYADQLAHQLSAQAAHEQLQRQIMLERERFPHPHASLVAQHEEYIRQQREREMKVRALEEAARGSRP